MSLVAVTDQLLGPLQGQTLLVEVLHFSYSYS